MPQRLSLDITNDDLVSAYRGRVTPDVGGVAQFLYGILSYAIGVAGLMALILATLGVIPFTGGPLALEGTWAPIGANLGLIALFGIQHAIMARPAYKERWTRVIPRSIERSTFVLLAGVIMGALVWLWQPLPDVVWSAQSAAVRAGLMALCGLGWAYLFTASFAIDHCELFGLRQVWGRLKGLHLDTQPFKERLHYRFDRHPIMTGVLIGLWSAPTMTLGRLVLALGFSAYIVVGVTMEERDLRGQHGEAYSRYARRVRTVVPRLGRRA